MTLQLELVEAQVRRLGVAPGDTLLVCPGPGRTWSVELCGQIVDKLQARMPAGAAVLVFSANVDLAVVENAPQGLEAIAASLLAPPRAYD